MKRWISCLESIYGESLKPDDYLFPTLGQNGTLQRGLPITHDTIQSWISEFAHLSGISLGVGQFTTHCFRRGGAQYRFMYTPPGKRWTLAVVRWWGGWAKGEHVSFKFLLETHQQH